MRAFKCTGSDGVSVFTQFRWPVPIGADPGPWVEVADPAQVCEQGLHACHAADLPYWLAPELWEIELAGEVIEAPYKLVASRGRLVRRVPGWPELERAFAESCAARVQGLAVSQLRSIGDPRLSDAAASAVTTEEWQTVVEMAEPVASPLAATVAGFALDCLWDIDQGYYAMCAYVAATAFGNQSTGDVVQDMTSAGWVEERARQADWLVEHLGLPG